MVIHDLLVRLEVRKSERLAWWFGTGPLLRLQSSCQPELEDPLRVRLSHVAGRLVRRLARALNSLPCGPLYGLLEHPYRGASGSPRREAFQEAKVEAQEHLVLPSCCWEHRASAIQCGKRVLQSMNNKKWRSLGPRWSLSARNSLSKFQRVI